MKMPKNMTWWPRHSRGKGTRHQGNARLQWRTFAADIMAFTNSNRRNDVRHYRLVHS